MSDYKSLKPKTRRTQYDTKNSNLEKIKKISLKLTLILLVNSIKITSVTGGVNNGGHLFKSFTPGFDSIVYIPYYVKYPHLSKGYFHHESIWFGGYRHPSTGFGSNSIMIMLMPLQVI